jgi:hypothetical protein
MKCEVCLQLLEEFIDGELGEPQAASLSAHLITCAGCAGAFDALTTEQEIYSRYDRALEIAPRMWGNVAARTTKAARVSNSDSRFRLRDLFAVPSFGWSFAGVMAVLMLALVIGIGYLQVRKQAATPEKTAKVKEPGPTQGQQNSVENKTLAPNPSPDNFVTTKNRNPATGHAKAFGTSTYSKKLRAVEQSDVLFSDVAYSAVEERETQQHIEQAQNLLRSVRNIQVGEDDEIDVSFEKALSRRLLNENVVLRRDAEMRGKFPTKILLSDLEPFLIDIANLPDKPAPNDLRVIKERVLKTEIVAALLGY